MEHINSHLQLGNCWIAIIGCPDWDRVTEVAFREEMESDLVSDVCIKLLEIRPILGTSIMSGDSSEWHCWKEDSRLCGSDES